MIDHHNIYIEQSGFKPALFLENIVSKKFAGISVAMSGVTGLIVLFLTVLFMDNRENAVKLLGLAEIIFGVFFLWLVYWLFLNFLEKNKQLTADELKAALASRAYGRALNFFPVQILEKTARNEVIFLKEFFDFLLRGRHFPWVLRRLDLPPDKFANEIKNIYQKNPCLPLADVLALSWQKALAANHLRIRFADFFIAVFELDANIQDILKRFGVKEQDVKDVLYWQRRREKHLEEDGKFWRRHNLLGRAGIGKNWAGGYTVNLDRVAEDLTLSARFQKIPENLYGRQAEVNLLERLLVRGSGNNAVLVGEPGIGRHTVLRAFASLVNSGRTFLPLRYARLLQIDSGAIIGGTNSLSQVLEKIQVLFGEAYQAGNIILVINDFDALLDSRAEAGRVNATEALLPFLQSGLRIVGLTTPGGYAATIGKNPQLARLVEKIEVKEPSPERTLMILEDSVPEIESQSSLFFTYSALKEIVDLSTKLIQNLPNPEKSLEILKDTAIYAATQTFDKIVLKAHVEKVVTVKTKVPVEKVAGEEMAVLLNLESILHERIIGQEQAVAELAGALRRARSGVRSEKKPIGSFLFLGPTGVGKTETAKALAAVYFGNEKNMIRFDMSEFQEVHGINRFIGDADSNTGGLLTEAIIANPFSVVLLDELEKAHPKIFDLFLQVFDEGRLTDALGRTVSFVNTMIIATSNAGAEKIREMIRDNRDPVAFREEILDFAQKAGIFRPEFLNRFDAVIIFRPLNIEELSRVAGLLLEDLNKRLSEKNIQVRITPELTNWVAEKGYNAEFGARPLRRFIQENIENYIAEALLSGKIQNGQIVEISPR